MISGPVVATVVGGLAVAAVKRITANAVGQIEERLDEQYAAQEDFEALRGDVREIKDQVCGADHSEG